MSNLYHVRFAVNSEPTSARFEFEENAKAFADKMSFTGTKATVYDEFADREENPVYVAEAQSLPNGLYLLADTPPTLHPLSVEDGSGDHNLLHETLGEMSNPIDVEAIHAASVLDVEGEAVVSIKGTEGVNVRIGVPEDKVDPLRHTVDETRYVYDPDAGEDDDHLVG